MDDTMRTLVAELLGSAQDTVRPHDDLLASGLDSLAVMRVVATLRRSGCDVHFAELVAEPTLAAWSKLIAAAAEPGPAADNGPAAGADVPARAGVRTPEPVGTGGPFPLSDMQRAYWIGRAPGQELGGVSAAYYVEFDGAGVEPARLEAAVRAVRARHPMLRARFTADGRQDVVEATTWPPLQVQDLRGATDPQFERELTLLRSRLSRRWLQIERAEVFDVRLSLLPGGRTRVHVNVDMLVCDAQSFRTVLTDLAAGYRDGGLPAAPGYTYQRYLQDLAARPVDEAGRAAARRSWADRLADLPGPPSLPLAVDPARVGERGAGRRAALVSASRWAEFKRRAAERGITAAAALGTAFAETLGMFCAEQAFLLNLPVFGRRPTHPDVDDVVGDFTDVLLLEVDLRRPVPFGERAATLQTRLHADLGHAEHSGLTVLRDLARLRPGRMMAAPVVLTSALGMGELFGGAVRECLGGLAWMSSQTPQVWLDHQVLEHEGGVLLNWDVVEELFPPGLIDDAFAAYTELVNRLAGTTRAWDEVVRPRLSAATEATRGRVNATHGPLPREPLHAGFFAQARRDPGRVALRERAASLSYGRLADRALRIAAALRSGRVPGPGGVTRPVGRGDAVAVSLRRGPDQIAAVLATLAAGASYVPVAADAPALRRDRIHRDAGVVAVLTDAVVEACADVSPLARPEPVDLDDVAYVIYTSGSTGVPKGVEVTHGSAANTVADLVERFAVRRTTASSPCPPSTSTCPCSTSSGCWASVAPWSWSRSGTAVRHGPGRPRSPGTASPSGTRCPRCWTCCSRPRAPVSSTRCAWCWSPATG